MNFTVISRNLTAGPIYTDRPSYQYPPGPESWRKPLNEPHHLNPSKSKLSVRSSLNKTNDNISLSNHNIDSVRASCFINNPTTTYQHIKRQSINEQKFFKSSKQNNDLSFQLGSKDSYYRYSTVAPNSVLGDEERKKTDSSYLRGSMKDACVLKMQDQNLVGKDSKTCEQIRGQLLALTKRVFVNQEQISKLKEKKQKDKKLQTLQQEFTQFQIQMFDILKKNSNFFSEFQDKLQKNSNLLNQMRDRVYLHGEREQIIKKITLCEMKISELSQKVKNKEENYSKNIITQLNIQENNLRSVYEMVNELKLKLDNNAVQSSQFLSKLSKLEVEIKQNGTKPLQAIRSNNKCYNHIVLQSKEILIIRQSDVIKDKTKQYINYDGTPKKQYQESSLRMDTPRKDPKQYNMEMKRELLVKQKIYYIDSQGYLLDQNKYYLLNSKNQQIMVPDHLLNCLRENNILVNPAATMNAALQIKRRE